MSEYPDPNPLGQSWTLLNPVGGCELILHGALDEGEATYWATCGCGDWRSKVYKKSETAAKHWEAHVNG